MRKFAAGIFFLAVILLGNFFLLKFTQTVYALGGCTDPADAPTFDGTACCPPGLPYACSGVCSAVACNNPTYPNQSNLPPSTGQVPSCNYSAITSPYCGPDGQMYQNYQNTNCSYSAVPLGQSCSPGSQTPGNPATSTSGSCNFPIYKYTDGSRCTQMGCTINTQVSPNMCTGTPNQGGQPPAGNGSLPLCQSEISSQNFDIANPSETQNCAPGYTPTCILPQGSTYNGINTSGYILCLPNTGTQPPGGQQGNTAQNNQCNNFNTNSNKAQAMTACLHSAGCDWQNNQCVSTNGNSANSSGENPSGSNANGSCAACNTIYQNAAQAGIQVPPGTLTCSASQINPGCCIEPDNQYAQYSPSSELCTNAQSSGQAGSQQGNTGQNPTSGNNTSSSNSNNSTQSGNVQQVCPGQTIPMSHNNTQINAQITSISCTSGSEMSGLATAQDGTPLTFTTGCITGVCQQAGICIACPIPQNSTPTSGANSQNSSGTGAQNNCTGNTPIPCADGTCGADGGGCTNHGGLIQPANNNGTNGVTPTPAPSSTSGTNNGGTTGNASPSNFGNCGCSTNTCVLFNIQGDNAIGCCAQSGTTAPVGNCFNVTANSKNSGTNSSGGNNGTNGNNSTSNLQACDQGTCTACTAPANTCSANNGTRTCTYDSSSSGASCTTITIPNQACTNNNCASGSTCQNNTCVSGT